MQLNRRHWHALINHIHICTNIQDMADEFEQQKPLLDLVIGHFYQPRMSVEPLFQCVPTIIPHGLSLFSFLYPGLPLLSLEVYVNEHHTIIASFFLLLCFSHTSLKFFSHSPMCCLCQCFCCYW
jgi:hypothetical protein